MTTDKPGIIKALVPLSRIVEDHDIQIRGEINSEVVKSYEAIVRETGRMDPVELFYDEEYDSESTRFMAVDGFHRIAAYRSAGLTKIPAYIRRMTRSEAIECACRWNRHGVPLTNQQKRNATEIAVKDARIGEFADAKIARMIGVSQSLVNLVRRGITPEAATERANGNKAARQVKSKVEPARKVPTEPVEQENSSPILDKADNEGKSSKQDQNPTRSRLLNQLFSHISSGVIDELDVIKILNTSSGSYVFLPNPGSEMKLRVVGANGNVQFEGMVSLKDIDFEQICVRYTAGGMTVT